jgi:uncharacterized protein YdeI (YjbR/CyaY-like superfamily)
MKTSGLKAFEESVRKPHLIYDDRRDGNPDIPDDLSKELKKNPQALKNFNNFSQSSRRMFIDWLNSAKKAETRIRRISRIVDLSERNIKPGMGVI